MTDAIIILITAGSADEAAVIARTLVDEHLAACVNILPGVRSFFFWEGATQDASETLMICKSRSPLLAAVIARVRSLHSYSVPEIIALPIAGGLPDYLAWLDASTKPGA
ncbi:MAG: divalent-cation tolerance protein CutA [Nitrospirota bacterium]